MAGGEFCVLVVPRVLLDAIGATLVGSTPSNESIESGMLSCISGLLVVGESEDFSSLLSIYLCPFDVFYLFSALLLDVNINMQKNRTVKSKKTAKILRYSTCDEVVVRSESFLLI